jgi:hypothetical protein
MLRVTEMDRRFETTLFTVWHFRWVASAVEDCIGARIILFANEIASARIVEGPGKVLGMSVSATSVPQM